MTDFEKGILFVEFLNTANFVFSNYLAVVFAMVAASFFLAHRMTRSVAALFLIMYTIGALMTGSGMVFAFTDFANLGVYIHETAPEGGGDLRWLGPTGPGGSGMGNMPTLVTIMAITAYLASLVFFFLARHQRLAKDNAPEVHKSRSFEDTPSA